MSVLPTSVSGIPSASNTASAVAEILHQARRDFSTPTAALAAVAVVLAGARGNELSDADLRLFAAQPTNRVVATPALVGAVGALEIEAGESPYLLGRLHELLLADSDRKVTGAHLTPSSVAAGVVATLDDRWCQAPGLVLDPAVGGGAFLLAAGTQLVEAGIDAETALGRLKGIDISADAVAVAEVSLSLWGLEHGVQPGPLTGLQVGDGLLDELPAAAVVVGNPPFLSQLRSASSNVGDRRALLRERWADLVGAYTDEAWLFLAAGAEALVDDGQLTMIQPLSALAASHGDAIREWIDERCDVTGIWLSNGRVFDAAVEVCAITLASKSLTPSHSENSTLRRWSGSSFDVIEPLASRPRPSDWGRAGAAVAGIPAVHLRGGETIGSITTATAGFRDQFYGFAPHVVEAAEADDASRLVTVGMIDPLRLRWGTAEFRFANKRWCRPQIDRRSLERADSALHDWVEQRMVPKLLVATQTRVIEAWVDLAGDAVPATPVISVEPENPEDCWHLAAALTSPPLSAHAAAGSFGTALAVRALKLSAKALLGLPLPSDRVAWDHGAALTQAISQLEPGEERQRALAELGATMIAAYRVDADELQQWWHALVPSR